MPSHIFPFNNENIPIVDSNNNMLQRSFFNRLTLQEGETFTHKAEGYETCIVLCDGSCDIIIKNEEFKAVGRRKHVFDGKPDSVYVPLNQEAKIVCISETAEVFIAGGRAEKEYEAFRVSPDQIDKILQEDTDIVCQPVSDREKRITSTGIDSLLPSEH